MKKWSENGGFLGLTFRYSDKKGADYYRESSINHKMDKSKTTNRNTYRRKMDKSKTTNRTIYNNATKRGRSLDSC